ncbi:MAG: pyruvate kinase alpha/beta domain-containing protein, partial [Verrucomicrobiales bacterium]
VQSTGNSLTKMQELKLIIFTASGVLANYTAHQRPKNAHIYAFSPDEKVVQALHMNRAVAPHMMDFEETPEATIRKVIEFLMERGGVEKGDPIVILSDVLSGDFDTEAILLRKA